MSLWPPPPLPRNHPSPKVGTRSFDRFLATAAAIAKHPPPKTRKLVCGCFKPSLVIPALVAQQLPTITPKMGIHGHFEGFGLSLWTTIGVAHRPPSPWHNTTMTRKNDQDARKHAATMLPASNATPRMRGTTRSPKHNRGNGWVYQAHLPFSVIFN